MIFTRDITLETQGNADVVDLTDRVQKMIANSPIAWGLCSVFCPGSTAAITTIGHEPGALQDLRQALEHFAPADGHYQHDKRRGDGKGHSHVRAALLGPSETFPIVDGRVAVGQWQQIVLLDLDNQPRTRRLVVTLVGD